MKKSALLATCLAALTIATIAIASIATRGGDADSKQAPAQTARPQASFATPF